MQTESLESFTIHMKLFCWQFQHPPNPEETGPQLAPKFRNNQQFTAHVQSTICSLTSFWWCTSYPESCRNSASIFTSDTSSVLTLVKPEPALQHRDILLESSFHRTLLTSTITGAEGNGTIHTEEVWCNVKGNWKESEVRLTHQSLRWHRMSW